MTVRALVIGLLLGVFIAAFGYVNDWAMKLAPVASDLIPISVFGLLVIGLLVVNPFLRLIRCRPLKGAEWAVIVSLMLVACVIPGPGLMWNFSSTVVMPHHWNSQYVGWRRDNLLSYVHPTMLIDPDAVPIADPNQTLTAEREAERQFALAVSGYKGGLNPGSTDVAFSQVPWSAWTRTLSFWMPLLALSFIGGICLVLVVHRQWAYKERLRYPVADFASELIDGAGKDGPLPRIFSNSRFWLGFVPVLVILLVNGYQVWNTDFIRIPLQYDLTPFVQKWPDLKIVPQMQNIILKPTIFFAALGFAYLVASEVSISIGISALVYGAIFLTLTVQGVSMKSDYLAGGPHGWQLFGAWLGLGLIVVYTGRRFYWAVLKKAFLIPSSELTERSTIWAARIGLLAAALMVVILVVAVNLHVMLAIIFVLLTALLFLILTRINVETGLFFIQPTWHAVGVILGLFGIAAVGPNLLLVLAMLSMVLTIDPRVAIMPLAANGLRLSESEGVRPPRLTRWMVVSLLLALGIGVIATIYAQHIFGGGDIYSWAGKAAKMPFEMVQRNLPDFEGARVLPEGVEMHNIWHEFRAGKISWDNAFLVSAGVGLALVLACSFMRLRYSWWPIHPVLFLVWGTYATNRVAASFLLGWFLKTVITKFGGGKAYRSNKPLFIGMIAAEFIAAIFWAGVGLIYYLNKGFEGPLVNFHP